MKVSILLYSLMLSVLFSINYFHELSSSRQMEATSCPHCIYSCCRHAMSAQDAADDRDTSVPSCRVRCEREKSFSKSHLHSVFCLCFVGKCSLSDQTWAPRVNSLPACFQHSVYHPNNLYIWQEDEYQTHAHHADMLLSQNSFIGKK